MEKPGNVTVRALRDLALLAGAGLAAASLWATGIPNDGPIMVDAQTWQDEHPRLGQDYALTLGATQFSLRVESGAKGMEYAIGYGGQSYSYVLGPFDASTTAVRLVADLDGDALPDFVVEVGDTSYLLLSTRAVPGPNLPTAELRARGDDGC